MVTVILMMIPETFKYHQQGGECAIQVVVQYITLNTEKEPRKGGIKMEAQIVPMADRSIFADPERFEFAQRVASVFAKSTMVPDHFKNNIGNCMIALNYAARVQADPFMIFQNLFVIHGKPGIEGKLVIALVNQSRRFDPLEFEEDDQGCLAFAKEVRSGKVLKGPKITWDMVRGEGWLSKNGSKWEHLSPLMFRYRAATYFARVYCPEVLLGMQTKEELEDVYVDMAPGQNGSYAVKEKSEQKVVELKERLAAARDPEPEPQAPSAVEPLQDGTPYESNQPPTPAPEPPADPIRDEFINLRSAGFSTWVHKNKDRFSSFPAEIQEEIREKWGKLYENITFPLDKKEDDAPQTNGNGGPMIWCPESESRKYVKVCEKCDKADKCQTYQEWVFENNAAPAN
jgi:hypothetical protein